MIKNVNRKLFNASSPEKNMSSTEKTEKPDWVKMKSSDVEKLIVDLGKSGESPAKIGLMLRDKHGIPKAKLLGKRISDVLNQAKIPIKTEKSNIEDKVAKIKVHIGKHKHDHTASRSLTKKLWTIHKIDKQTAQ